VKFLVMLMSNVSSLSRNQLANPERNVQVSQKQEMTCYV